MYIHEAIKKAKEMNGEIYRESKKDLNQRHMRL